MLQLCRELGKWHKSFCKVQQVSFSSSPYNGTAFLLSFAETCQQNVGVSRKKNNVNYRENKKFRMLFGKFRVPITFL